MSLFKGKTLMITGGTGSFGNAVLNRFLKTDIGEIRIFSRDEKKQDDMRHDFQARMPEVADKIKFYIGDVRDLQSVDIVANYSNAVNIFCFVNTSNLTSTILQLLSRNDDWKRADKVPHQQMFRQVGTRHLTHGKKSLICLYTVISME